MYFRRVILAQQPEESASMTSWTKGPIRENHLREPSGADALYTSRKM